MVVIWVATSVFFMIWGCCFMVCRPAGGFQNLVGTSNLLSWLYRVKVYAKNGGDQSQSPHTHRRVSSYKNRGAICFQSWTVSMYHRIGYGLWTFNRLKSWFSFFFLLNTTVKNYLSFTCKYTQWFSDFCMNLLIFFLLLT